MCSSQDNLGSLDIRALLEPIGHLIPPKPQEELLPAAEESSDSTTDQSEPVIETIPDASANQIEDAKLSMSGEELKAEVELQSTPSNQSETGSVRAATNESEEQKSIEEDAVAESSAVKAEEDNTKADTETNQATEAGSGSEEA